MEPNKEDFFARPDLATALEDVVADGEGGGLKVTVHNIGNRPAGSFSVALLDAERRKIAVQTVEELDAPLDLVPRRVEVRFARVPGTARSIEVDPDNDVAELNEENNSVMLMSR
jgi:subtilase family serine protease